MKSSFSTTNPHHFECIEPDLGDQIWRLEDPHSSSETLAELKVHVVHCAACRFQVGLQREVEAGLSCGDISLSAPVSNRDNWARWGTGLGSALIAACLALVFILPPVLSTDSLLMRGEDSPVVLAPLPDVVILDRTPVLSWTELDQATRYKVQVRAVDGAYMWKGESASNSLAIPTDAMLPISSRVRVEVTPVPAFAAPDGALRSSFRTGTWAQYITFRFGAAPPAVLGGILLGGLVLVGGLATGMRRRTESPDVTNL